MNYLYNGVELPDINSVWTDEWKAEYPYACILKTGINNRLLISPHPLVAGTFKNLYGVDFFAVGHPSTSGDVLDYAEANFLDGYYDDWSEFDPATQSRKTGLYSLSDGVFLWSSYDIINEDDNTIYFSPSDPIPVNPAPTLDPTALLMGWRIGQKVASQRK